MGGDAHEPVVQQLLALLLRPLVWDCLQQRAVPGQLQTIAHPGGGVPAGRRNPALLQQSGIVFGQRLQNHETTSQSRRSSTPFTSFARKKRGRMF